jgi:hypothetical protein
MPATIHCSACWWTGATTSAASAFGDRLDRGLPRLPRGRPGSPGWGGGVSRPRFTDPAKIVLDLACRWRWRWAVTTSPALRWARAAGSNTANDSHPVVTSASRQFGRPACGDGARTEGLLDLKGGPTAMPVIARTARHISAYSYRLTGTYGLAHHRDRDRNQPGAAAGTGLAAPPPDRAPITGCGPERTAT